MTASNDRLLELLTDRAVVGLSAREQIELAELLVQSQDVDIAAFDKAAAAIALASVGKLEKMPAGLAERLEEAALGPVEAHSHSQSHSRPASDFMRTRELDKLAPALVRTQVDPVSVLVSETSDSEPTEIKTDFKKTHAMDDRPAYAPASMQDTPASIPTLTRPGDPPRRPLATTNPLPVRAQAPASLPAPSGAPSPSPSVAPSVAPQLAYPPVSGRAPGPSSTSPPSNVVPFPTSRAPSRAVAIGGWVAAAACFLLAIGAFALRSPPAPVVTLPLPVSAPTQATVASAPTALPTATSVASQTPAELRAKLLAAKGSARAEWTPTKDPLGKDATGEVVWNKEQQKGTMRFKGLAKNDPSRAQYQLWIFDKTRDEKYPVDGGVFDVDSETGDVIVPIRATLPVNAPVLFAVTLEKPGGVVVSKREHIVVTAKLPAG